jgi:hypothetical protein
LSFCTFSFGHCVVCSSSIYGFWLPPFGIFKLFLSFCPFSFGHCVVCTFSRYSQLKSLTNKIDRHDTTEILLKVALNTITITLTIPEQISSLTILVMQMVNFITCGCESSAPFYVIYKAGREPMLYWW